MAQVTQLHRTDPKGCHHGPPGPQNSSTGSSHCRPTAARQPLNPALPGTPLPLQARPRRASAGPHGLRMQSRLGSPEPQSESPGSQTQQEPGWSSEPHKARAVASSVGRWAREKRHPSQTARKILRGGPRSSIPDTLGGGEGAVCRALVGDLTSSKTTLPAPETGLERASRPSSSPYTAGRYRHGATGALTGPMLRHLEKRSSAAMCSYSFCTARRRRLVLWWRSYRLRNAAGVRSAQDGPWALPYPVHPPTLPNLWMRCPGPAPRTVFPEWKPSRGASQH